MINLKKKIIFCVFGALTSLCLLSTPALADFEGVSVSIDGEKLVADTAPVIIEGRTMVPMRAIFESLGAKVEWDDFSKTVSAYTDKTEIKLAVGESEMLVNGKKEPLDVSAIIRNGRTLVPLRAVAEALDVDVNWYSDIKTVSINTKDVEKAILFNLNHEEIEIDKAFYDEYLSIGFKESIDGLYKTLYSSMTQAEIPIDTVEENMQGGWSEKKSAISINDESFYERAGNVTKIFWHPQNTSGRTITKYTVEIYYVEKDSNKGFQTREPSFSGQIKNGEKFGITSTDPESCFFEFTSLGECSCIFIGNVTLRYRDGNTQKFWCGQALTEGDKWDGTVYDGNLKPSKESGKGNIIYNVYNTDGETKKVTLDEFETLKNEGWYLTPVVMLYCKDGSIVIAAADKKDELLKEGLTDDIEDILIKVYDNAGNITAVNPAQLYDSLNAGYKEYKAPIKVLYADDGTTVAVEVSQVQKYINSGWHTDIEEILTTVYAPDETSQKILKTQLESYLAVGWSTYPVTTVYDSAGYGKAVRLEEKESYLAKGYLASLDSLYFEVYHPDGRCEKILPYQKPEYIESGWYLAPVLYVYNENGEVKVVEKAHAESFVSDGWAVSEEDFYRSYFSLTGKVKGLKSDEGKYIENGWKMIAFPIKINDDMRLERANIWSVYSYKLYWHPENVSGKTIENYRIEYYIPQDGTYIKNFEDMSAPVENGKTLGHSEFADHFLVSVPEGSDTVIIGKITVQYDDGKIEDFWCGQAVTLSDEKWNGALYNEKFIKVETVLTENGFVIIPVGKTR